MSWTAIIVIVVLAFCMLGCCGSSIFRRRGKDPNKNKDHDDTHKGCH